MLSVMQSSLYYRAAWEFACREHLPLALIVYDDPEEIEPIRFWTRPIARRINKQIYQDAQIRFCVSPQMCSELRQRYGASGETLYPNRPRTLRPRQAEMNLALRRDSNFVIAYGGSLSYGYGFALGQLLPVFRR